MPTSERSWDWVNPLTVAGAGSTRPGNGMKNTGRMGSSPCSPIWRRIDLDPHRARARVPPERRSGSTDARRVNPRSHGKPNWIPAKTWLLRRQATADFRLAAGFRGSHSARVNFLLPPGGVLLGLGTDVIEIARVKGVYERQGERFLLRVFTAEERAYCLGMKYPEKHLAARFAAKEAISKAFTTGIGAELSWTSMSVYHGPRHEPLVRLDEKGAALLRHVGGTALLLSIAHCDTVAVAVAAIVQTPALNG